MNGSKDRFRKTLLSVQELGADVHYCCHSFGTFLKKTYTIHDFIPKICDLVPDQLLVHISVLNISDDIVN